MLSGHRCVQKLILEDKGPNSKPIVYFIYSDASQVITIGKGFSFHRIIVFIGSRGKYSYRTIGWLPITQKSTLPFSITKAKYCLAVCCFGFCFACPDPAMSCCGLT